MSSEGRDALSDAAGRVRRGLQEQQRNRITDLKGFVPSPDNS